MLVENVKKIEQIWKNEGLDLARPLSRIDIFNSFANFDILLSKDVIDIYSTIGGMTDNESDSVLLSFWTVEKILAENEPKQELICFADFLIYSHLYGFKFENEDTSSIHIYWGKNQIEKIADSFDEFFENYIINPGKYYLFDREN